MASEEEKKGLAQEEAPVSIRKGQISYNGLQVMAGRVREECNRDLQWPYCMETYKNMAKDATIAPTLNLMEMSIAKAEWHVRTPEGYDDKLKEKAEFLESIMRDMETPWNDFIRSVATFARYGFAPIEKVYRKRDRKSGSRYRDGLYGIRRLPLISQDSIQSWQFSKDGRSLLGLNQKVVIPSNEGEYKPSENRKVRVPRDKFILFRADPQKDSPIGTSPLNNVYVAWRFKTELERHESISIANDLRGLKVFKIPARYMSDSASEEEKKTYEVFKEMLRGLHNGDQSGVIIPNNYDEQGKPLFEFDIVNVLGQSSHDLDKIIRRYRAEIVTGILNPQLILGQDGSGSFALAEALNSVTNTVVDARLKEIRDQLNHDLIPQLFAINGWDTGVTPYFDYVQTDSVTMDELSKFIQRVASVGLIKQDATTVNWVAEQAGMPIPFDDTSISQEEVVASLTGHSSRGGEGMASPGEGTSQGVFGEGDSTISNTEN